MVNREWLTSYKEHILELWYSEYPEEGEPMANVEDIILDQLNKISTSNLKNQLTNSQLTEGETEELDEKVMNSLANEHFANE